jgi:hypothetical protein
MKPTRASLALLTLPTLLAVVACDPTFSVSGTVVDASGAPVAGATVTMACPSGRTETVTTSAGGEYAFGGVGGSFEAPKCSLRIEKPGFTARTVRTTDACYRGTQAHNAGTPCKPGEGKVVLTP